MKLELQKAKVKNIAWGDKTALLADGTLQINKEEFIAAAADSEHFKTLDADLARPGESVRVCPVKDVIEPRYKTEGSGQVFPGMLSDVETVGSGKTFVLEGAAVLTCGRIVGFQEGIIDMQGPGADYTPFSKTAVWPASAPRSTSPKPLGRPERMSTRPRPTSCPASPKR